MERKKTIKYHKMQQSLTVKATKLYAGISYGKFTMNLP